MKCWDYRFLYNILPPFPAHLLRSNINFHQYDLFQILIISFWNRSTMNKKYVEMQWSPKWYNGAVLSGLINQCERINGRSHCRSCKPSLKWQVLWSFSVHLVMPCETDVCWCKGERSLCQYSRHSMQKAESVIRAVKALTMSFIHVLPKFAWLFDRVLCKYYCVYYAKYIAVWHGLYLHD